MVDHTTGPPPRPGEMFLRQLGHELYKMFARKRTHIGFGAFVVVQVAIVLLLQHPKARAELNRVLSANGLPFEAYYKGLTLGLLVIVFTFALLGALYIALVSGDIVAKEVEEGTMRMILARPISRFRLLLIKWLACSHYTVVLVLFLGATALLTGTLYRGGLGRLFIFVPEEQLFAFYGTLDGLWRYSRAIVCLSYSALAISSTAFMFSCFRMKPAAATILTLSVIFIDLVLQAMPFFRSFEHWFVTYHMRWWVRTFHDPVPWPALARSVIVLAALNLTFAAVGITHFCTRDLKR